MPRKRCGSDARGRASNGSVAAEVCDALEKLGGITAENVKLLPRAVRVRGFAALCEWKKTHPIAAASMNERGHDASRRYLCQFVRFQYLISDTDALFVAISLVVPDRAWVYNWTKIQKILQEAVDEEHNGIELEGKPGQKEAVDEEHNGGKRRRAQPNSRASQGRKNLYSVTEQRKKPKKKQNNTDPKKDKPKKKSKQKKDKNECSRTPKQRRICDQHSV